MKDADRFKLHFGPYKTPRFKYGACVRDEVRGEVVVVGMTDGPIPWPLGRPPRFRGRASLVVYRGLLKAIRRKSNLAVAHWWGVNPNTVSKWRRVLEVEQTTEGTSRLRSACSKEEPVAAGLRKAQAKAKDPKRRAKISAALQGNKQAAKAVKAAQAYWRGRRHKKSTRRKMSEAHRRRGTIPPLAARSRPWTPEEDAIVRAYPPAEAAKRAKRTLGAVWARQSRLGIRDGRTARHCRKAKAKSDQDGGRSKGPAGFLCGWPPGDAAFAADSLFLPCLTPDSNLSLLGRHSQNQSGRLSRCSFIY